jgi:hypothetical protein
MANRSEWLHTIEGMQDCASLTMLRFHHGYLTSPEVKAVASLLAVSLMLEKAKRERDDEAESEEGAEFVFVPAQRGVV